MITFAIRSLLFVHKYSSVILTFQSLLEVMLVTYRSILISLNFSIVKIRAVNDRWDLSWNQPYANYVGAVFHLECRGFLKRNKMKNHKLIHIDLYSLFEYLDEFTEIFEGMNRKWECVCDILWMFACSSVHIDIIIK